MPNPMQNQTSITIGNQRIQDHLAPAGTLFYRKIQIKKDNIFKLVPTGKQIEAIEMHKDCPILE
jgi:adenine-specific DNA methylase